MASFLSHFETTFTPFDFLPLTGQGRRAIPILYASPSNLDDMP